MFWYVVVVVVGAYIYMLDIVGNVSGYVVLSMGMI